MSDTMKAAKIREGANSMLAFDVERVRADFPILQPYTPSLQTAMVDWSPSEFSRLRLQLARDKSRPDATDNQIFLQYILSLGTHGAHTW